MTQINEVESTLKSLATQSWNTSFYGRCRDKKDALYGFKTRIQDNWKDANGSAALSCANKIDSKLNSALTQFGNVEKYVNLAIQGANDVQRERAEKGQDQWGNSISPRL